MVKVIEQVQETVGDFTTVTTVVNALPNDVYIFLTPAEQDALLRCLQVGRMTIGSGSIMNPNENSETLDAIKSIINKLQQEANKLG